MKLEPRIRSASEENAGAICCTSNDLQYRCAKCQAHAKRSLRSAEDFSPPDPYKAGIERMQQEQAARAKTTYVPPSTELPLDANGIPDAYAAGLAAMRKEGR